MMGWCDSVPCNGDYFDYFPITVQLFYFSYTTEEIIAIFIYSTFIHSMNMSTFLVFTKTDTEMNNLLSDHQ